MKNYSLFLLFLVGITMNIKAQYNTSTTKKNDVVYIPKYYKEKGVIFSEDYVVSIDITQLKNRYTPTIEDIDKLEDIFSKKYNEIQKTNFDTKDFFCHWVRQYVGFIDSSGNKNIIVQLINNTKPRKINKLLGKNWEDAFVIMLADSFYKVSTIFRINIDTNGMVTKL